jgi:diphosphate-dependent phosphofructokinase
MTKALSPLSQARKSYQPKLPTVLRGGAANVAIKFGNKTESVKDQAKVAELFQNTYGAPTLELVEGQGKEAHALTVGVILSGGQAPGGHNVIAGIFDGIKSVHSESRLLGFLGGPGGFEEGKFIEITASLMDEYRNTGGFDIIASGRTKLETHAQFDTCIEVVKEHLIDTIVIIGGDDSNTNAAVLAEYFKVKQVDCSVIGCPKTIDGDLKNEHIEASFGFDTAAKTYSELIGNIARDANSARKYWHFIKLMGRSASHIALECALQTQPNICLISEEVEARQMTLSEVVKEMADIVETRLLAGKSFGVALIPEGLIEFIPEIKALISELNDTLAHHETEMNAIEDMAGKLAKALELLSESSETVLKTLPQGIQYQLLLDRDPHGNVQVSLIETEKLLIEMVGNDLKARGATSSFKALNHFFGYEGRCAIPSNFDADYCYSLGYVAAILAREQLTGYMSSIKGLINPSDEWVAGAIPTTMMMNMERRHGEDKPVIQKALVELEDKPFKTFAQDRKHWAHSESYLFPGAIQYYGPSEVCDITTTTIQLETKA